MTAPAPMTDPSPSRQLDLFRGLAAVCMVINHAAAAAFGAQAAPAGWVQVLAHVGGWAPMLFFAATGIGMGLAGRVQPLRADLWRKAGLLLLADALLNWSLGRPWGLDFFGFIALAMVAVALVRARRQGAAWALAAIALLLAARWGLAPLSRRMAWPAWLDVLSGVRGTEGISYPLAPWLAFALGGWLLAHLAARARARGPHPRAWAALPWLAGALLLAAGLGLAWAGAPLLRWGQMSLAYFVHGVGALALCWALAGVLARAPLATRALALRGPASLLVVPLHYAALGLLGAWARPPAPLWALATALLVAAVLVAARALARALAGWRDAAGPWPWLLLGGLLAAGWALRAAPPPPLLLAVAVLGQVMVAWCLMARGEAAAAR